MRLTPAELEFGLAIALTAAFTHRFHAQIRASARICRAVLEFLDRLF